MTGAKLDNGLLMIDLERPLVEPQVRTIEIARGGKDTEGQTIETGRSSAKQAGQAR